MKGKRKNILKNTQTRSEGFRAPEGYFAKFEENFELKKSLNEPGFISPENYLDTLDELIFLKINSSGFQIPPNYFDTLENKILYKQNTYNKSKVFPLIRGSYTRVISLAVAASILLFFSVKIWQPSESSIDFNRLELTEIEAWMEDDLISFSSYEISETFSEIDLLVDLAYSDEELMGFLNEVNIENIIIED